jgi:hypothetical protein
LRRLMILIATKWPVKECSATVRGWLAKMVDAWMRTYVWLFRMILYRLFLSGNNFQYTVSPTAASQWTMFIYLYFMGSDESFERGWMKGCVPGAGVRGNKQLRNSRVTPGRWCPPA